MQLERVVDENMSRRQCLYPQYTLSQQIPFLSRRQCHASSPFIYVCLLSLSSLFAFGIIGTGKKKEVPPISDVKEVRKDRGLIRINHAYFSKHLCVFIGCNAEKKEDRASVNDCPMSLHLFYASSQDVAETIVHIFALIDRFIKKPTQ